MGDSRFHLKVEFTIYGKTYKHDCSLNWTDTGERIDRRIIEMFEAWHDEAYFEADTEREEREAREAKEQRRKRFLELKDEFEPE